MRLIQCKQWNTTLISVHSFKNYGQILAKDSLHRDLFALKNIRFFHYSYYYHYVEVIKMFLINFKKIKRMLSRFCFLRFLIEGTVIEHLPFQNLKKSVNTPVPSSPNLRPGTQQPSAFLQLQRQPPYPLGCVLLLCEEERNGVRHSVLQWRN